MLKVEWCEVYYTGLKSRFREHIDFTRDIDEMKTHSTEIQYDEHKRLANDWPGLVISLVLLK